jgi:hypothetical protein
MSRDAHFTPNDYSPTYYVRIEDDGEVELLRVRDLPPEWDDPSQPDKPSTEHLRAYAERWVHSGKPVTEDTP